MHLEQRARLLGPGLDPSSELGPLVSDTQRDRVCGYIEHGVAQGAKIAAGGGRVGERGYFVQPTVLTNSRQEMRVVQEEIFGSVVVALPFDDADDAVRHRPGDGPCGPRSFHRDEVGADGGVNIAPKRAGG